MKFEERMFKFLTQLAVVAAIPDIGKIIERANQEMPPAWPLPKHVCAAVGGGEKEAIEASIAIACCQISIILIDDLLDEDPRGEHHRIGVGSAANYASAFQTAGIEVVLNSNMSEKTKLLAIHIINSMMRDTAAGQEIDIQNPDNEEAYWQMVRAKSSPYFGAAFAVGALFGGASPELAYQMKKLGELHGEIVQIGDDLEDTMESPAGPDWGNGRYTLPILFASIVEHPERQLFLEIRKSVETVADLEAAQDILIRCGAVGYCLDQILWRYEQAKQMWSEFELDDRSPVEAIFLESVTPVWNLLGGLGEALPEDFRPNYGDVTLDAPVTAG
ncbi:MAG: hypothetical protein DWQ07_22660 [Chloroflexi bacterium]|nr:MAG: hypothetical protein DWQ07_22660 [Chloroflexota bacterium]MBL1193951.1 hypothetical protein [Chloroflexota bacterium]NOH11246.1 hypothetical protein [Chloroflexota bacterium]